MNEKECLIFLNLISVGYRTVQKLRERYASLSEALSASAQCLEKIPGIRKPTIASIVEKRNTSVLKNELGLLKKSGCRLVAICEDEYPSQLKEIHNPPLVLYIKGDIAEQDINSIAIVGTRKPTDYGKRTARKIAFDLAGNGVTVVSGLAVGLDSQAHQGALDAGGRTIAVLGSGLMRMYPQSNVKMAKDIEKNGAVISEFPLEVAPFRSNFPIRNRIISGLSLATVVVEASAVSGTLITAGFALDQGRTVFAVPGNIDQPTSEGANALIKQGASLIQSTEDIFREVPYLAKKLTVQAKPQIAENKQKIKLKLSDKEQKLVEIIIQKPLHIDEITDLCDMASPEISVILLTLEMKKIIKQLPGKYYSIEENIVAC